MSYTITKEQSQSGIKQLNAELFDLAPSAVITLFEIDCQQVALDYGLITNSSILNDINSYIFRFHNHIKLINTSIFWRGNEYIAAPISAEGFEMSTSGTLPTPKLAISVNEDAVSSLSLLKEQIYKIGDITGAKVTRYRTLLKYLDAKNFINLVTSDEFEPNPSIELAREVYYIDRKSLENRQVIEYQLASIIDVEGLQLPRRLVLANKCPFFYRGFGCLYEYNGRAEAIHEDATLPFAAPAVANEKDEKIETIVNTKIIDRGEYDKNLAYRVGDSVFIKKNQLKYYFVCKVANTGTAPPNMSIWIADTCSKTVSGCKVRFSNVGSVVSGSTGFIKGRLPYGGFSSVNRVS